MVVVVSYDVKTSAEGGKKRLRAVAQACADYGQRVQFSVFECSVGEVQWVELRRRLAATIDPDQDSLRIYFLGEDSSSRIEHLGTKIPRDLDGPLVV
ncbi:MAG TPA: CRISPR-associated endonuclease Cas2 [Anaeromyxobacter sp.]